MKVSPSPAGPRGPELAVFVAILVVGILLISIAGIDPLVIKALADLAAAYLAWRIASLRGPARGGSDLDPA